MHKPTKMIALLTSFVLILTVSLIAAASSNAKTSASQATTKTKANGTTTMQPTKARHNLILASPEQISGTISFIGSSEEEVTLIGANGIPYDFQVTRRTKFDVAGKRIGAAALASEHNKQATIHFLPTASGNLAQMLDIAG